MNKNNTAIPNENHKTCWFCGNRHADVYQIELVRFERHYGEIGGGRKYSRYVEIPMCNKCSNAINKQIRLKGVVYFIVLLSFIITSCIYCYFESSMLELPPFNRILYGLLGGVCIGPFLAWGVTALIPNSPVGKNKLLKSLRKHPDIIAANLDGYFFQ